MTTLDEVIARIDAGELPHLEKPNGTTFHEKNGGPKVNTAGQIGKMPIWDRSYDDIRTLKPGQQVSLEDAQLVMEILRENGFTMRQSALSDEFEQRTGRKHSTVTPQVSRILYFLDRADLIWPSKIISTRNVIWMATELAAPRRS